MPLELYFGNRVDDFGQLLKANCVGWLSTLFSVSSLLNETSIPWMGKRRVNQEQRIKNVFKGVQLLITNPPPKETELAIPQQILKVLPMPLSEIENAPLQKQNKRRMYLDMILGIHSPM